MNLNFLKNLLLKGNLTVTGDISGTGLRTSFNQGSATGDNSFAVGLGAALGEYSHAEGIETIASGRYSHAEGDFTIASGEAAHAEGVSSVASGYRSHAEGGYTAASGNSSHAEGRYSEAKGNTSHAAGYGTTAGHDYSYAWSDGELGTREPNLSSTREGQYMIDATGGVYIPRNVGIGTDNNSNALTVVGTVSTSNHGNSNQWNSAYTTFINNSANYILNGGNSKGTNLLIGTNDNFNLNLETANSTRMAVTSTGNIGIGITNPGFKLHISDGNPVNTVLGTSDIQTISYQSAAAGYNFIIAGSNASERGVFKGTRARGTLASPTAPTTDDSVLSFLGAIYDGSTTQATALVDFLVDGAVSSGVAPQRISFITSSTNAGARTEKMTIKSSGNVGIGTTTPNERLTVVGNISAAGDSATVTVKGTGNPTFDLETTSTGTFAARFRLKAGSSWWGYTVEPDASTGSPNAFNFYDYNANQYRMVIRNTTGNIGINTTNPNERLTVVGNISATGTGTFNTIALSSVTFTGETKTSTTSVTATDTYVKVIANGQTKYLRLFDVI